MTISQKRPLHFIETLNGLTNGLQFSYMGGSRQTGREFTTPYKGGLTVVPSWCKTTETYQRALATGDLTWVSDDDIVSGVVIHPGT